MVQMIKDQVTGIHVYTLLQSEGTKKSTDFPLSAIQEHQLVTFLKRIILHYIFEEKYGISKSSIMA